VRFSFIDPVSKDIKSVWESRWGTKKKSDISITKVKLMEGIKDLVFVYPTYIVAIKQHFEYNYKHFNYVFNPKNLSNAQKTPGAHQNLEIYVVHPHDKDFEGLKKINITFQIVDTKQLRTYSQDDKNKATISAIIGTLVEFQVPDINFRGNNIDYTLDLKGANGILISKNSFEVTSTPPGKNIQLLDELYGQSLDKSTGMFAIHICEMIITENIKVECKATTNELKLKIANPVLVA
jgi:hypothetical protein